jgi:hypothetical protein
VEEGGGGFGDFMESIQDEMTDLMKKTNKAPKDAMEQWNSFSSAIDWTESWIRLLMGFHVILFLVFLIFRKNVDVQTCLFFFIVVLVYFSERVNSYCATHWAEFATQNYFDEHGVFSGLLFSGPLLTILLCQLVNFLSLTSGALVQGGRLKVRQKMKDAANKDKAE